MKRFLQVIAVLFLVLSVIILFNYKRLNIIAGFAAKISASSVFIAERDFYFTDTTDTNFTPVNVAKNTIDMDEKSVTSSVLGLLKRKAVYREGVGSVLVVDDKLPTNVLVPKRNRIANDTVFYPYGSKMPKDTVFTSVNYKQITTAIDSLFAPKNKTRAALVIHKNRIIVEHYAKGFNKHSLLLGWSMTKSITGSLFGVLEHQGKLNVNDRAPIAAWKNDDRSKITIHNLLQMNSGLEWTEEYDKISDVTKMLYLEEDMTQSQIQKPLAAEPNTRWLYSSGTSNVLSKIIRNQFNTHQEYLDFWYTGLIDKIGMHSMVVETDLAGNYIASSYSWATTRDWAKIGLLYLHNGNWNGEQIFDANWVKYATRPTPTSNGGYGASVWLNYGNQLPDVAENVYHFRGYQGQYVFVLPDQETVIVRLGLVKDPDMINDFVSEVSKAIN